MRKTENTGNRADIRMENSAGRTADTGMGNNAGRKAGLNRLEISVKGLILAVVVIIACVLSAIALYMVQRGKSTINSANDQYSALMSDFTELDKTIYDGLEVSGDDVIKLIDDLSDDSTVSVVVTTLMNRKAATAGKTYCASAYTPPARSDADYINVTATFKGKVTRNENGIVTTISFVQQ